MKPRNVFFAALSALFAAPVAFVACEHDHDDPPVTGACADPTLLSLPACGTAGADPFSDEACAIFDDRITRGATTDAMRSATITAPTEMQSVPGATPFAFTWTAPTAWRRPSRPMNWRDELARWTTLVPEAQAHCEAFSGRAYELSFKVGTRIVLGRQQSFTTWTPDAATWTRLRTAAGTSPVELTIYAVTFNANQVSAGPFVSGTVRRFTIAP